MYEDFTKIRIAQLRTKRGVSARDMSLSLGAERELCESDREWKNVAIAHGTLLYLRILWYYAKGVL